MAVADISHPVHVRAEDVLIRLHPAYQIAIFIEQRIHDAALSELKSCHETASQTHHARSAAEGMRAYMLAVANVR